MLIFKFKAIALYYITIFREINFLLNNLFLIYNIDKIIVVAFLFINSNIRILIFILFYLLSFFK